MLVAWKSWRGCNTVDLPASLTSRQVSFRTASALLEAMAWSVERLGLWCRPAWPSVVNAMTGRPAAALVATMGLLIVLPLPGSNLLPSLAAVSVVAGQFWNDGRALGLAYVLGIASVGLVFAMLCGLGTLAQIVM